MSYIRGIANQPVECTLINAATGGAYVGTVTVYLEKDNGAQFLGSVNSGVATAKGNGTYSYVPTSDEFDANILKFTFVGSGAVPDGPTIATLTPAQVSAQATATGLASVSVTQVITEALMEIRVARAGDALEPDLLAFGVSKLNRLLDRWNADPRARYTVGFTSFTPTPGHQPHTIGPSGADWAVTQRPRAITAANIILNTVTPNVRLPITIRDAAWWRRVSVQGLQVSPSLDLYYQPDWPNGSVFLWPVPSTTWAIELQLDGLFGVLQATDTFWLPFGYRDAITLTLAEELAPGCGQMVAPSTQESANQARAIVFSNNDDAPYLSADAGLGGGHTPLGFNWASRTWNS